MKDFLWWFVTDGSKEGRGSPLCNFLYGISFTILGFGFPSSYVNYFLIACGIFMFLVTIFQVSIFCFLRWCKELQNGIPR